MIRTSTWPNFHPLQHRIWNWISQLCTVVQNFWCAMHFNHDDETTLTTLNPNGCVFLTTWNTRKTPSERPHHNHHVIIHPLRTELNKRNITVLKWSEPNNHSWFSLSFQRVINWMTTSYLFKTETFETYLSKGVWLYFIKISLFQHDHQSFLAHHGFRRWHKILSFWVNEWLCPDGKRTTAILQQPILTRSPNLLKTYQADSQYMDLVPCSYSLWIHYFLVLQNTDPRNKSSSFRIK